MSTDAMDTEEGDAITKMILDKTKVKAQMEYREGQGYLRDGTWGQMMPQGHCLYLYLRVKRRIGQKGNQLLPCHLSFSQTMRK